MATVSITSDLEPYLASLRSYLEDNNSQQQQQQADHEKALRCCSEQRPAAEIAAEERARLKEIDSARPRPTVTKSLALRSRV